MSELELRKYEAPELEIIEVKVENGFGSSGDLENPEFGGEI